MTRKPFPVELEPLLLPIPGDNPVGEWLRYESTYDKIQEARREDDESIPQGIWKTSAKKANWKDAARLCGTALRERSKDLQIAAWLLEAWLRSYGFSGVEAGLKLIAALCERYWEKIYPELDGDDATFRLKPLDWIDQKVPLQMKMVPVTRPQGDDQLKPAAFADWEAAIHRDREEQREGRAPADESGIVNQGRFMSGAALTPPSALLEEAAQLDGVLATIEEMNGLLTRLLGREQTLLLNLRRTTTEIRTLVRHLLNEAGEAEESEAPGEETMAEEEQQGQEGEGPAEQPAAGAKGGRSAGITSRSQAYQRLLEAADYLMRTEPHSPTPYLVKRAVAWGHMSLVELMAELVQSPQDLRAIYSLLGIQKALESE